MSKLSVAFLLKNILVCNIPYNKGFLYFDKNDKKKIPSEQKILSPVIHVVLSKLTSCARPERLLKIGVIHGPGQF